MLTHECCCWRARRSLQKKNQHLLNDITFSNKMKEMLSLLPARNARSNTSSAKLIPTISISGGRMLHRHHPGSCYVAAPAKFFFCEHHKRRTACHRALKRSFIKQIEIFYDKSFRLILLLRSIKLIDLQPNVLNYSRKCFLLIAEREISVWFAKFFWTHYETVEPGLWHSSFPCSFACQRSVEWNESCVSLSAIKLGIQALMCPFLCSFSWFRHLHAFLLSCLDFPEFPIKR